MVLLFHDIRDHSGLLIHTFDHVLTIWPIIILSTLESSSSVVSEEDIAKKDMLSKSSLVDTGKNLVTIASWGTLQGEIENSRKEALPMEWFKANKL